NSVPRPLRNTTSALTMAAAANSSAPPIQMATRATAATALQASSMIVIRPGESGLIPKLASVGFGRQIVPLAHEVVPLGCAGFATTLCPPRQDDFVERLFARLQISLRRPDERELAGRADRTGAGAGITRHAFLGLVLDQLPGLVLVCLHLF